MKQALITIVSETAATNYEQMASLYNTISFVLFALSLICLVISGFLFFRFNIPIIIGDLSGRNARKSIEQMREQNEKNKTRKSVYPKVSSKKKKPNIEPINPIVNEKVSQSTEDQPIGSEPTDVLDSTDPDATTPLNYDEFGTELLEEGTTVLSDDEVQAAMNNKTVNIHLYQNIILVHTPETIF